MGDGKEDAVTSASVWVRRPSKPTAISLSSCSDSDLMAVVVIRHCRSRPCASRTNVDRLSQEPAAHTVPGPAHCMCSTAMFHAVTVALGSGECHGEYKYVQGSRRSPSPYHIPAPGTHHRGSSPGRCLSLLLLSASASACWLRDACLNGGDDLQRAHRVHALCACVRTRPRCPDLMACTYTFCSLSITCARQAEPRTPMSRHAGIQQQILAQIGRAHV